MNLTSTADDGGDEQSQVTVVQLQCVELHGKLEFRLHHVAERSAQAFQELPGDEARAVRHEQPVLVHAGGQQGEEGFIHAVLQKSHLVIKVQGGEARYGFGKLRELRDGLHRRALAAVENTDLGLAIFQGARGAHHLGHQRLLCQLKRLHVVNDERLRAEGKNSVVSQKNCTKLANHSAGIKHFDNTKH